MAYKEDLSIEKEDADADPSIVGVYRDTDNEICDIYIADELEDNTHGYRALYQLLQSELDEDDKVNIYLACNGGSVATAQRICRAIKRCKGHVTTYVDAPCQSAGSLIALAGNDLKMAKDAFLMFHGANGAVKGNLSAARQTLDITHRWCYANDMEFISPFLTDEEIVTINTKDVEIHVFGDDPTLDDRIKRHFT